jgi:probable F420-dependent oxidoreductase
MVDTPPIGIRPPGRLVFDKSFEDMVKWVVKAEKRGFDSVHFGDRLLAEAPPLESTWHDITTALASFASQTNTIKFGPLVWVVPYRHPIRSSKILGSLDTAFDGRLQVGVGAGWNAHEFESLDIPRSERGIRLEEGVEIMKRLWTENSVQYEGDIFDIEDVTVEPKPVQTPHPPIWFGSFGHTVEDFTPLVDKVLRRVGRLGDGWVPQVYSTEKKEMITPEKFGRAWDVIADEAVSAGRDPDDVEIIFSHHYYVMEDEDEDREKCMNLVNKWLDASYEEAKDTYLIGSPEEIVEQIEYSTANIPAVDRYIFTPFTYEETQVDKLVDEIIPELS